MTNTSKKLIEDFYVQIKIVYSNYIFYLIIHFIMCFIHGKDYTKKINIKLPLHLNRHFGTIINYLYICFAFFTLYIFIVKYQDNTNSVNNIGTFSMFLVASSISFILIFLPIWLYIQKQFLKDIMVNYNINSFVESQFINDDGINISKMNLIYQDISQNNNNILKGVYSITLNFASLSISIGSLFASYLYFRSSLLLNNLFQSKELSNYDINAYIYKYIGSFDDNFYQTIELFILPFTYLMMFCIIYAIYNYRRNYKISLYNKFLTEAIIRDSDK